jgi:serine/threonine protein kinase
MAAASKTVLSLTNPRAIEGVGGGPRDDEGNDRNNKISTMDVAVEIDTNKPAIKLTDSGLNAGLSSGQVARGHSGDRHHNHSVHATSRYAEDKYNIGAAIGYGVFGVVYKVTRKTDQKVFACKCFKSSQNLESELKAVKFLQSNRFHNVVEIEEVTRLHDRIAIIMELLEGGEVFRRIEKAGCFSERDAAIVMKDLAQALVDLESSGIIHRDIKTENLVYVKDTTDSHVKLIDFGLAVQVPNVNVSTRIGSKPEGSAMYLAPETLNNCWYSCKSDIWSAGISLYVLLVADNPFDPVNSTNRFMQISHGQYHSLDCEMWSNISDDAKDLLRWMLRFDPAERPSAADLLQHRWITKYTAPDFEFFVAPVDAPTTSFVEGKLLPHYSIVPPADCAPSALARSSIKTDSGVTPVRTPVTVSASTTERSATATGGMTNTKTPTPFATEYMTRVRNKLARDRLRRAILCVRWTCHAKFIKKKQGLDPDSHDSLEEMLKPQHLLLPSPIGVSQQQFPALILARQVTECEDSSEIIIDDLISPKKRSIEGVNSDDILESPAKKCRSPVNESEYVNSDATTNNNGDQSAAAPKSSTSYCSLS